MAVISVCMAWPEELREHRLNTILYMAVRVFAPAPFAPQSPFVFETLSVTLTVVERQCKKDVIPDRAAV